MRDTNKAASIKQSARFGCVVTSRQPGAPTATRQEPLQYTRLGRRPRLQAATILRLCAAAGCSLVANRSSAARAAAGSRHTPCISRQCAVNQLRVAVIAAGATCTKGMLAAAAGFLDLPSPTYPAEQPKAVEATSTAAHTRSPCPVPRSHTKAGTRIHTHGPFSNKQQATHRWTCCLEVQPPQAATRQPPRQCAPWKAWPPAQLGAGRQRPAERGLPGCHCAASERHRG